MERYDDLFQASAALTVSLHVDRPADVQTTPDP